MLTLRDVVSSRTHSVSPDGAVIGREGGDADIVVQDPKVSKRHAKLFAADGRWWLEDLQSANGTYLDNQRIAEAVEVVEGTTFRLAAHDFHVVDVGEGATRSKADARGPATLNDAGPFGDPPTDGAERQVPQLPQMPNVRTSSFEEEGELSADGTSPDEMAAGVTPQQMIMRAIAFHLTTVPLLALNPVGTVRKTIERQRFQALEKMPLLGLAAPGLAILLAVGVVFQIIAAIFTLIAGGGFSAIKTLVVGIVVAVVGAAIGGLILAYAYHPVFKFILERLFKGQSTMRSRTNFLAASQSAGILAAVPNGLAALVALLAALMAPRLPRLAALLPIAPSIVQLACTLIIVLLTYRWLIFFQVHKIVPILVLVGGGLAVLSTAWGVVNGLRVAITGEGGSAAVAGMAPGAAHLGSPVAGGEVEPPLPKLPALPPSNPAEAAKIAAATAAAAAAAAVATAKAPEKTPEVAAAKEPAEPAAAPKAKPEPAPAPDTGPPVAPPPARVSAYQRYALKRDAVEKAITDDPLILRRDASVSKSYKAFRAAVAKARKAEAKKSEGDEVLLRHLIDADVYGSQVRVIDDLYTRMHLASQPSP